MDQLRQAARDINAIKKTANYAAKKHPKFNRVERGLDTFDQLVPYTLDFRATDKERVALSLLFKPPAPSICCGECYCSVCEVFANNLTITLTYGYISGTLNVFVGASQETATRVTDYTELDPDAGTLQLNTTGAFIRVCYIYYAGGCGPIPEIPCGVTIFDTFNREVTGSLGTSTDGHTWTTTLSTGVSFVGTDTEVAEVLLNVGASNEFRARTNSGGPWSNPNWEATFLFSLTGGGGDLFFGITNPHELAANWIQIDTIADVIAGPSGQDSASYTLDNGVYYRLKWQVTDWTSSPTWKARIWKDGDPEPSTWLLSDTGTQSNSPDNQFFLYFKNSSIAFTHDLLLDEISFDTCVTGGGEACGFIDLFEVANASSWNSPWVETIVAADALSFVSGGAGVLRADTGNIKQTIPITNAAFTLTCEFSVDVIPDWNVGTFARFDIFGNTSGSPNYLLETVISNATGNTDGYGGLILQDSNSADNDFDYNFAFTANTHYMLKLQSDGVNQLQAKLWEASDPEPGSWTVSLVTNAAADSIDVQWVDDQFTTGPEELSIYSFVIEC